MAFIGLLVSVLSLLAAGPVPTDKVTTLPIQSGGVARTCYVYLPRNAGVNAPAPLIIMLHGSNRTGDVLVEAWKGLAKKQGIVLAGPEAADRGGWRTPGDGPDFLRDVVEAVSKTVRIDRRRIYLFGHSAGAVFSLYMGLLESKYFAAVALHAGAFRDPADYTYLDFVKRPIPFKVFVGTRDPFFSLDAVRTTRDAFVKAGLTFDVTEMKDHDHNYYVVSDGINKAAWQFLSTHALTSDPEYEVYGSSLR